METKHLKKDFPSRSVPKKASEVFQRFSDFRNYNNSLEQMVALYNYLKSDTVRCEFALISDDVAKLDKELQAAEHSLTWNSGDMWEYIEGLRTTALDINTRVKKCQENISLRDESVAFQKKMFGSFGSLQTRAGWYRTVYKMVFVTVIT